MRRLHHAGELSAGDMQRGGGSPVLFKCEFGPVFATIYGASARVQA